MRLTDLINIFGAADWVRKLNILERSRGMSKGEGSEDEEGKGMD